MTKDHSIMKLQVVRSRVLMNAEKLTNVIWEHGDPFMATEDENEIYNILTKEFWMKNN